MATSKARTTRARTPRKAATKAASNDGAIKALRIIKRDTCQSTSGKSNLDYCIAIDINKQIQLSIVANDGGGFTNSFWVSYSDIRKCLDDAPLKGIKAHSLHPIFQGRSANSAGFLVAILRNEGLVTISPDSKRLHMRVDPAEFESSIKALADSDVDLPNPFSAKTK